MLLLIFKYLTIFSAINIVEIAFLKLFKVDGEFILNLLLNNVIGFILLFTLYHFKVLIYSITLFDVIFVSSGGLIAIILLLMKYF